MVSTEFEATWCWNIQSSFLVSGFVQEWNLYSTNSVNDFLKRAEVNIDVMVNGDSEVLINGVGKCVGVLAFEGGVNAV